MKINNSPRKTSNNFNINDIEYISNHIIKDYNNIDTNIKEIKNVDNFNLIHELEIKEKINYQKELIIKEKNNYINFNLNNESLTEKILLTPLTNSTIIINYSGNGYHNGKILINNTYKTKLIIINRLNNSDNLLSLESLCQNNLDVIFIDLGNTKSIINYYSKQITDSIECSINTICMTNKSDIKDINYLVEVYGKNNKININVENTINKKGIKHYKGTIDFKKGCLDSIGKEKEHCLLLSNDNESVSLPMILCSEQSITGNHSTSQGKIDSDKLFYLMSRGIDELNAKKLIILSRFNKILNNLEEPLYSELLNEIERNLK